MASTPTNTLTKITMGLPIVSALVRVVDLLIVVLVLIIPSKGAALDPVS